MIKILGERCSGKTTKLLNLAHENGYILVEPTFQMAEFAKRLAKELGYDDVEIVCALQFNMRNPGLFMRDCNNRYLMDELDMCLKTMNVVGYSNTDNPDNPIHFERLCPNAFVGPDEPDKRMK